MNALSTTSSSSLLPTRAKSHLLPAGALALLTALLPPAPTTSRGQSAKVAKEAEEANPFDEGPPAERFDIQTEKVPLSVFIEILQDSTKAHLNIICPDNLEKTTVPALDLRAITFAGVVDLLSAATQSSPEGSIQFVPAGGGWTVQRSPFVDDPFGGRGMPQAPKPKLSTFALGSLLDFYEIDDVLTLIHEILTIDGSEDKITMKYHEETKTLLMVLNPDQKSAVSQAITQLQAVALATPKQPKVEELQRQETLLRSEGYLYQEKIKEYDMMISELEVNLAEKPNKASALRLQSKLRLLQTESELAKKRFAKLVDQQMELESQLRAIPPKKKKEKESSGDPFGD